MYVRLHGCNIFSLALLFLLNYKTYCMHRGIRREFLRVFIISYSRKLAHHLVWQYKKVSNNSTGIHSNIKFISRGLKIYRGCACAQKSQPRTFIEKFLALLYLDYYYSVEQNLIYL